MHSETKYDQICCSFPGTVRQDGVRGIVSPNPNMRNDKLRSVFEKLGFENVKTVISSGNVVFESPSRSIRKLEERIEKALPEELGFNNTFAKIS